MRELGLFEQYLIQLRQEKLKLSHSVLKSDLNDETVRLARIHAYEADMASDLLTAIRALANDPGLFIQEYLKP